MTAGDLDAAAALWAEDALFVAPDGAELRGIGAIKELLGSLISGGAAFDVRVERSFVAGRTAIAVGALAVSVQDGDGDPSSVTTRFTVVYVQGRDGTWKIAIDAPAGLPATPGSTS